MRLCISQVILQFFQLTQEIDLNLLSYVGQVQQKGRDFVFGLTVGGVCVPLANCNLRAEGVLATFVYVPLHGVKHLMHNM